MDHITLVGFLAATLTTSAFAPQAIKVIQSKDTKAISLGMYVIMTLGIATWFIYGVVSLDWPILIANAISFLLAGTVLIYKIRLG